MTTHSYVPKTVLFAKRTFDIVLASTLLIMVLPLLPLIAILIKLDSPGPVIFKQLRIGRSHHDHVEMFWMYKFRSMRSDAEAKTGAVWASKQDPRITRLGRFLRKSRIDELPQIFNVLRGDMSLIGPRPERPGFYGQLETAIPFYAERTYGLRPGVTGLAQVYQGYDESLDDVRSKVSYDHAYALQLGQLKSWLAQDVLIVFRTVGVMVLGRGQ